MNAALFAVMNAVDVHRHVRAALSAADELSRREYAQKADRASQTLAALRTTLGRIDLALGRSHRVTDTLVDELHTLIVKLRRLQEVHDRAHVNELLDDVGTLERRLRERAEHESPKSFENEALQGPAKKKRSPSLLAHLGLGLVPNRPLRELPIWRLMGLCLVFAAASVTMLLSARHARRDK